MADKFVRKAAAFQHDCARFGEMGWNSGPIWRGFVAVRKRRAGATTAALSLAEPEVGA